MPLKLVKSARTKNLILAPSIQKLMADETLFVLATTIVKGENMVPVCHTNQDSVSKH